MSRCASTPSAPSRPSRQGPRRSERGRCPLLRRVDKGLDGPNAAGVHFYFESMEAMQAAFGNPKMGDVMADVANYTNITSVMQVSEIVIQTGLEPAHG